ncbi:AEL_collapsed_G0028020.mRNA.1.CDS.1 [Saccharomyces cerevisiae]|uniref:allantoinase n=1 Tax=Saccharomyces pastorianus TaxID=27292 RepID=A0A6C1DT88_SACPS|nr:Allantoinase [Saccharomyces pastorianus]CAI5257811.1 AEL_HP2_G0025460.mRNA.1.CDS.1 [Saccharomyces cerevisiae]CAI5260589.1 AAC_HP2_G0027250.mRNA.1.CDS.1 [Saccharomyces cerevisiae]CAI6458611.1 AEL_HP2_G0025460.mRNA.1.CDS.1 [Saccharomyces cerevisiae]CAI6464551.1 AAC_HP2_G0027250.mRNA.1.CDS.1 [Saccharomyces cerevisiae]
MPINAITSDHVIINGANKPATIVYSTESGKILDVLEGSVVMEKTEITKYEIHTLENVSPCTILPGLVDSHVHLNEPGRTNWEGFETGTQAAISGGVTTVVDMPLNAIPPTTNVENFRIKLEAAEGQMWCDVGFWGGLVPHNLPDLIPLVKAGVRGFKGFLLDSGVEEFPPIGKEYIEEALKVLAEEDTMMMFHAELPKAHEDQQQPEQSHREYSSFLSSRPDSFEIDAINLILECLRARNGPVPPVHIVHLASMKAIPLIRKARASGLPVTTETCFHYLCIAAEQIPDGATHFKCCPPIRSESNRQGLWDALREGVIGSVVSDHSPCTPELKNLQKGDFFDSWGGIASVGLGLPLMFTQGCSLVDIVTWCCKNTSHQVGLSHQKGTIAPGYDADLVVFDTASEHKISNSSVYFKNKLTAYNGMTVKGTVLKTILRGQVVYTNANGVSKTPLGQTLLDSRR